MEKRKSRSFGKTEKYLLYLDRRGKCDDPVVPVDFAAMAHGETTRLRYGRDPCMGGLVSQWLRHFLWGCGCLTEASTESYTHGKSKKHGW